MVRFRNSDFPELAKFLADVYAQIGIVSSDPEFTQLPLEPIEAKPDGRIVRGFAICPSQSACDLGSRMPFNLEASL